MSAEIVSNAEGILTIKVSGKVAQPELAAAQKSATEILKKQGPSRLLVLAESFQGWGKGNWGDLSGQQAIDSQVDRMAIVGEKQWEDLALLFTGKGFRRTAIEYFTPADLPKARAWLASR